MTDHLGTSALDARLAPLDDAAREEQHAVLASLLSAYVDGELPGETVAQIDAHLLGCARCRREVRVQQAFGSALAATMATEPGAPAPAALLARVRDITAAPPVGERGEVRVDVAPVHTAPRALPMVALVGVLAVGAAAAAVLWSRPVTRDAAPSVLASSPSRQVPQLPPTVLDLFVHDYRTVAAAELPGRARDLDAVRRAIGVPVEPLAGDQATLVAAWTADLDGELAAVLAYRWGERLVLQYVSSDALLFRSAAVREAFAAGRAAVYQRDSIGVVAWSTPRGGAVLVGVAPWSALQSLQRLPSSAP